MLPRYSCMRDQAGPLSAWDSLWRRGGGGEGGGREKEEGGDVSQHYHGQRAAVHRSAEWIEQVAEKAEGRADEHERVKADEADAEELKGGHSRPAVIIGVG